MVRGLFFLFLYVAYESFYIPGKGTVSFYSYSNLLYGMFHCGMVSSANESSDAGGLCVGNLRAEIHGYLTRDDNLMIT